MFSARVPSDLHPNPIAAALARLKIARREIIDLTVSNPTTAGFAYPDDLLHGLSDARSLVYAPEPFGLAGAREAVAADFHRRGIEVALDHIALTASTSEAYSVLFKLLCNPGDEVLVPQPSYPLFEHLTRLDALTAVPYDLEYHGRWSIDLQALERAFTPRTRAVLLVTPNNPTGNYVSGSELERVAALCRAHDAAIVSDEVFADYELLPGAANAAGRVFDRADVLGFTLGGLSKSVGLPQAKLAWIAMSGPAPRLDEAKQRLELVCDTYLSVSTPVQVALWDLLERGAAVRAQIQQRTQDNHRTLAALVSEAPSCELLHVEGGWSSVVRVPATVAEDELVLSLLDEESVLVHPGYFFDFPSECFLIVSLLAPEAAFAEGVSRVLGRFGHAGRRP